MSDLGVLFLDLEETVINNWLERELLFGNLRKISEFISNRRGFSKPKLACLGLFSYAVSNQSDLSVFHDELKRTIEKETGLFFNPELCLTVEKLKLLYTKLTKVNITTDAEFNEHCNDKAYTFFRLIPDLLTGPYKNAILIDDLVSDMKLTNSDTGIKLETANINKLLI